MKLLGAILAFFLGVSAFPSIDYRTNELRGSDAEHWRLFTGSLQDAKEVVVYLGAPRRDAEGPRPEGKMVAIHDFEFFDPPLRIPPEIAARLTALVCDQRSFLPYSGFKFCGGFHPDLCVEWRFENNGQRWRRLAFICLGCQEWRLVGRFNAVHTNMSDDCHKELTAIARILHAQRFP